jgi:hypothetical protein
MPSIRASSGPRIEDISSIFWGFWFWVGHQRLTVEWLNNLLRFMLVTPLQFWIARTEEGKTPGTRNAHLLPPVSSPKPPQTTTSIDDSFSIA